MILSDQARQPNSSVHEPSWIPAIDCCTRNVLSDRGAGHRAWAGRDACAVRTSAAASSAGALPVTGAPHTAAGASGGVDDRLVPGLGVQWSPGAVRRPGWVPVHEAATRASCSCPWLPDCKCEPFRAAPRRWGCCWGRLGIWRCLWMVQHHAAAPVVDPVVALALELVGVDVTPRACSDVDGTYRRPRISGQWLQKAAKVNAR